MTNNRGNPAGSDEFQSLMRHPYGEHLWSLMDRGLNLLSTLLHREFAEGPAVCRLAAAEILFRTNESWAGNDCLLPEAVGAWAHRFREHYYKCWCETAECGLHLDDRAALAIRSIAEAAASSVTWLGDGGEARRFALAGLGIAVVASARATDDENPSWVPPDIKRWSWDQYDGYLP